MFVKTDTCTWLHCTIFYNMSTFYFVVVYKLLKSLFIVTYRSDLKLHCNQLVEQDVLCTDCAGFVAGLYRDRVTPSAWTICMI